MNLIHLEKGTPWIGGDPQEANPIRFGGDSPEANPIRCGEGEPLEVNPIRCREGGEPLGVNPIHLEKGTPLARQGPRRRNHSQWLEGDFHLFRRRGLP